MTPRGSEDAYYRIFQFAPDGIVLSDLGRDGVLDVNERFEQISGYSREEILGRTLSEVGLLMDPLFWHRLMGRLRSARSVRDLEYQMRRKTGDIATIAWSAAVIEIHGRLRVVSIHRDTTR